MPLIAEDLLLLLLDDEDGRVALAVRPTLGSGLGAAVLAELTMIDAVTIGEAEGLLHRAKVHVAHAAHADADPVLRNAVATVAEKERSAQSLVSTLGHGLEHTLLERLAEAGLVRREEERFLLVFDRTAWPAADAGHEADVRRALRSALVDGAEPDERTTVLIALLHALGRAHHVVRGENVESSQVKRRAEELAEGERASAELKRALDAAAVGAMVGSGVI